MPEAGASCLVGIQASPPICRCVRFWTRAWRSSYRHGSCSLAMFDGRRIRHVDRPVLAPPSDAVEAGGGLTECVRADVAQPQ